MEPVAERRRAQAPPARILLEDLSRPARDDSRAWFGIGPSRQLPEKISQPAGNSVRWSSIWPQRPDAVAEFVAEDIDGGCRLTWRLYLDDEQPDVETAKTLASDLDYLVNSELRRSYGQ